MGGAASNPYDDEAQKRTKEIIEETVVEFQKQYLLNFPIYLLKKLQEDTQAEGKGESKEEKKWLLESDPEPPEEKFKEGELIKQGAVRKNWKKRYFIIHPDYTVTYRETKETEKPKGTINLNGYWVSDFQERPLTLTLRHWRRRQWYFQAETEKEYNSWKDAFRVTCRKAPSPMSTDPVLRKSFQKSYLATYKLYWGWASYFYCTGSEPEMIGELVMRRLRWSVLWRVYQKLSGPAKMQSMVRNQIETQVNLAVDSACAAGWTAMCEARDKLRPTLEEKMKQEAGPIFEQQAKLMDNLKEKLMGPVNAALDSAAKPLIEKAVGAIFEPIMQAMVQSWRAWMEGVSTLRDIYKDFTSARSVYWLVYWNTYEARRVLWGMQANSVIKALTQPPKRDGPDETGEVEEDGVSNDDFVWTISDELVALHKQALYTLSKDKDVGVTEPKLMNDAKLLLVKQWRRFLLGIIQPNVMAVADKTVGEICRAIDDLIPEPIKTFFSTEEMANKIIEDICGEVTDKCVEENSAKWLEAFETAVAELARKEGAS